MSGLLGSKNKVNKVASIRDGSYKATMAEKVERLIRRMASVEARLAALEQRPDSMTMEFERDNFGQIKGAVINLLEVEEDEDDDDYS